MKIKNKKYYLVLVVIMFILASLGFLAISQTKKTQIIVYIPAEKDYPKKIGECNKLSRATQGRPDTYRCLVGNERHDPCFLTPSKKIICDSNPKIVGGEFELITTSLLPPNSLNYREDKRFDWAYELDDGTVCFLIQGTAGTLESGESYYYSCDDGRKVIGDVDKTRALWSVQTIAKSKNNMNKPREVRMIKTVWF